MSASTASGVVRGRPGPRRGTRTSDSMLVNIVDSLPCPGPSSLSITFCEDASTARTRSVASVRGAWSSASSASTQVDPLAADMSA